jgi:O-antigen ligase
MNSLIVFLLLFFLPFVFWLSPLRFELAKTIFFYLASFLALLSLLRKPENIIIDKAWFLWVGVLYVSSLLNQNFINSFVGYGYHHQGIIFFLVLGLWQILFRQEKHSKVLFWLGLTAVMESIIILFQKGFSGNSFGTLGTPHDAAGFLLIVLPVVVQNFSFFWIVLVIAGIIATGSQVAILILAALGFYWFLQKRSLFQNNFKVIIVAVVILLAGIAMVYLQRNESPFENRYLIWTLGFKAFLEKPIFGYGPENIMNAYDRQYYLINLPLSNLMIDRSHNFWLDILLFSGLSGFFFFGKWLINRLKEPKENWQVYSLLGLFLFSFFQPLSLIPWVFLVFILNYPVQPLAQSPLFQFPNSLLKKVFGLKPQNRN